MFDFLTAARSSAHAPLTLVDIGAAGGIQPKWLRHGKRIRPVLFEANPAEAARLRALSPSMPDILVVPQGLAAAAGDYTLKLAHWPGCSSLLEADPEVLEGYRIAPLYSTVGRVDVHCERYDALHRAGTVPRPDVVKIDVEGYEYEVLCGFGDLLHGVLGIETEAWFYPVFKGQKLLHDLVALLAPFGLHLRRIEAVDGFEGDLVCVNAYFTRGKAGRPGLTAVQHHHYTLLQQVWRLDVA